jgi:hypothetical protein
VIFSNDQIFQQLAHNSNNFGIFMMSIDDVELRKQCIDLQLLLTDINN